MLFSARDVVQQEVSPRARGNTMQGYSLWNGHVCPGRVKRAAHVVGRRRAGREAQCVVRAAFHVPTPWTKCHEVLLGILHPS